MAIVLHKAVPGFDVIPRLSKRVGRPEMKYTANQKLDRRRSNSQGNHTSGDEMD